MGKRYGADVLVRIVKQIGNLLVISWSLVNIPYFKLTDYNCHLIRIEGLVGWGPKIPYLVKILKSVDNIGQSLNTQWETKIHNLLLGLFWFCGLLKTLLINVVFILANYMEIYGHHLWYWNCFRWRDVLCEERKGEGYVPSISIPKVCKWATLIRSFSLVYRHLCGTSCEQ